jgi:hypothetical protein
MVCCALLDVLLQGAQLLLQHFIVTHDREHSAAPPTSDTWTIQKAMQSVWYGV